MVGQCLSICLMVGQCLSKCSMAGQCLSKCVMVGHGQCMSNCQMDGHALRDWFQGFYNCKKSHIFGHGVWHVWSQKHLKTKKSLGHWATLLWWPHTELTWPGGAVSRVVES